MCELCVYNFSVISSSQVVICQMWLKKRRYFQSVVCSLTHSHAESMLWWNVSKISNTASLLPREEEDEENTASGRRRVDFLRCSLAIEGRSLFMIACCISMAQAERPQQYPPNLFNIFHSGGRLLSQQRGESLVFNLQTEESDISLLGFNLNKVLFLAGNWNIHFFF